VLVLPFFWDNIKTPFLATLRSWPNKFCFIMKGINHPDEEFKSKWIFIWLY
jgi:hypothetical protein